MPQNKNNKVKKTNNIQLRLKNALARRGAKQIALAALVVLLLGGVALVSNTLFNPGNRLELAQAGDNGYGCGEYGQNAGYGEDCENPTNSEDIFLIEMSNIQFTPDKANAPEFGQQNVNIKVTDSRITDGATCSIQLRPYPSTQDPNPTFATTRLTNISGTYTAANGCSADFPAANQSVARWEYRVRITNPNSGNRPNQVFGADPAYFLLFGAVGFVSIGGTNL